jgi:O-antigen biosynthesis protein WbqV
MCCCNAVARPPRPWRARWIVSARRCASSPSGDGRLACFQGGEAVERGKVEAARVHDDPEYRPFGFAPHSRYQRVSGRDIQVMIDAGPPATGPWSLAGCAQPLAVEITAGEDRLVTNGGWSAEAAGPQALRMTAASSTLGLGEASTGELLSTWAARTLGPRLTGGPTRVDARRNEAAGGTWVELSHDGWAPEFGLIHERRLFMDASTDELRGEDRLLAADGAQPAATPYVVRFHLHPDVEASFWNDGRSILLVGSSGRDWWFRNDAPEVTIEPSVHFAGGLPQRTQQIVLRGGLARRDGRPGPLEDLSGRGSARVVTRRSLAFNSSPGLIYAHDLAMAAAAMALTLTGRYAFEGKPLPSGLLPTSVVFFTAICAIVFPLFGLHRALWRYTALNDLWRVFQASVLANLTLLPFLFAWNRLEDFPRSTPFLATGPADAAAVAGRAGAQVMASRSLPSPFAWRTDGGRPAVVIGDPGEAGDFISQLRRGIDRAPQIAGVVAVDEGRHGRTVRGVEVLGSVGNLAAILKAITARDGRPPQVVIADPRPSRALLETVIEASGEAGAPVVRARPSGGTPLLSPVQAADLLARPPRRLDLDRARSLIEGRRVLVTGAGGTIGGELTRQTARLNPAKLILLDASEYNLYAIDQQLKEEGLKTPWTAELGDIRSLRRMRNLFERTRPEVVLHAAALKHVPLMETHPAEAVLTNVAGAINIMQLARESGAAFVFISTDKAVNPTNVMGATKRVAERAVQALAAGGQAKTAIVRFGNVLGSAGSVVPLFEKQIAFGGPVTVTDPGMLRWFMTVQEAASLVLQAAALPTGEGEAAVYVLDMGDPVKIDDLARQMIRLHGLRPEQDIAIRYTGLRPGEKLSEEIFYGAETVRPTEADGVLAAKDQAPDWASLSPMLDALIAAAAARDEAGVLAALKRLEPAFTPGPAVHPADEAADASPEGV